MRKLSNGNEVGTDDVLTSDGRTDRQTGGWTDGRADTWTANKKTLYPATNVRRGIKNEHLGQGIVVVVALLFYVHGKHLRSCRDGQLT